MALLSPAWEPEPAQAAPAPPAGAEPCHSCHGDETAAWQHSLHAIVDAEGGLNADCVACHGPYTRDHPGRDLMELTVDSSVCSDCHDSTFRQWEGTTHAAADVQCIGCHNSHSQALRLTDESLCVACHKEPVQEPFHTAHWNEAVGCTECHLAADATGASLASADTSAASAAVPDHDFVSVAPEQCLDCHRQDVGMIAAPTAVVQSALASGQEIRELTTRLEVAERRSGTLRLLTPMVLGIGVGVGALFGIVFMLVAARIERRGGGS